MANQPGQMTLAVIAGSVAIIAAYIGAGALIDATHPVTGWLKNLRDAGIVRPAHVTEDARLQEAFAYLLLWVTSLYCAPYALLRSGWRRWILLPWPAIAFLLPFLAGNAGPSDAIRFWFWPSILFGFLAPWIAIRDSKQKSPDAP